MPNEGKGLGEIVRDVAQAFDVSHFVLKLRDPVLDPIEAHVAGLGKLRGDGPVSETHGDFIVAMDHRGRLGVTKIGEDLTFSVRYLGGGKRAGVLSFLDGGAHDGDAGGVDGDGGIDEVGVVDAREVVERAGNTAGFGTGKVGGVGEDVQDHGRRAKDLHAVRMHGGVSQETLQVRHGVEGGGGQGTG